MGKCGIPLIQVGVNIFEAVYMPFKNEAMDRIETSDKSHIIIDKYSTHMPEQSDEYVDMHVLLLRG